MIFWTNKKLKNAALKYTELYDFYTYDETAYKKIRELGLFEEYCSHLKRRSVEIGHWDKKENLEKVFKKCKSLKEVEKKYHTAYLKAKELGFYEELAEPLRKRAENGRYTKNYCRPYAEKCQTFGEFKERFPKVFDAAYYQGFLYEIGSHLKNKKNLMERALYAIEFDDGSVYVGLTWNYKQRFKNRKNSQDYIYQKMQKCKHKIIKFDIWYDTDQAPKEEILKIEKYKRKGWKILNIKAGGDLGAGKRKWTEEKLEELFLQYEDIATLKADHSGAYSAAIDLGVLQKLTKHIKRKRKPPDYWNRIRNQEAALICKTKSEFLKKFPTSYTKSKKEGYFEEITLHMVDARIGKRDNPKIKKAHDLKFKGLTVNQISKKLKVSTTTVRSYLKQPLNK